MIFLCDDIKQFWPEDYGNLTKFIDARNWEHAEQIAKDRGLVLVGQFASWVCEDTGEREYIQ